MEWLKRAIAAIFDFLQGIVAFAAVLVMIYLFIMSPQEISGASMEPNFHNKEYILTNKVLYRILDPQRGDIVIFKSPKNKEIDYIKRIIGLPGETVAFKGGMFYINGQPLEEPYQTNQPLFGGGYLKEGQEIIVPPGMYFVVGDNRPGSSDSRDFGPVPKEDFLGKAFLRYWPTTRLGLIPQPNYSLEFRY